MHGSLLLQQIAGRGEGHVDFEGFRKIYDEIMTVKEVSVMIKICKWSMVERLLHRLYYIIYIIIKS